MCDPFGLFDRAHARALHEDLLRVAGREPDCIALPEQVLNHGCTTICGTPCAWPRCSATVGGMCDIAGVAGYRLLSPGTLLRSRYLNFEACSCCDGEMHS